MVDYEKISAFELQELARQGDNEALFEMAYRFELMPANDRDNSIECCAWQDYWLGKAADAGNIAAKSQYANSLINRIMNAEDRQNAMRLFKQLAEDFDSGKLSKDKEIYGIVAKLKLGIMLCEGYHTQRDVIEGVKHIEAADTLTNGFEKFGFGPLRKIGEMYNEGLAQQGEEPSIADLEKAIKYLETAVKNFVQADDDPNNRGYLQLTKDMIENNKQWKAHKEREKTSRGWEDTNAPDAEERRIKRMEVPDFVKSRMDADKAALTKLRQRLAQEGW